MKKNLIKSLKNLLKAYGGENSNKNNAVQIIDEITETLGGETTSKSKNLVEAIDKLSNQVSEGGSGGNPNRVQVIEGPAKNPWGEVGLETLAQALATNNATAFLNGSLPVPLEGSVDEYGTEIIGTFCTMTTDGIAVANQVGWAIMQDAEILFCYFAYDPSSSKVIDMSKEIANTISITIIWHPLPEASS